MTRFVLALALLCGACSGGAPGDSSDGGSMMTGGEDLSSPVANPCPAGFFKLAATGTNATAGVALLAGVLGSGGTARQKPLAGDAWLQNMTDMIWMDTDSMGGNSAAATLALARNETMRELSIHGESAANSNTAGLIVTASARMTEVTVSLCDAAAVAQPDRAWKVNFQCSGTSLGQANSSLNINGSQLCMLNTAQGGYVPASGTFNLPDKGFTATFKLSLNWNSTGNGSGTKLSRSDGNFKLTVQ